MDIEGETLKKIDREIRRKMCLDMDAMIKEIELISNTKESRKDKKQSSPKGM